MNADIIRRGIAQGVEDLRAAGHDVRQIYIPPDPDQLDGMRDELAARPADCVLIGGGVRMPPRNLLLFEAVLNVIARADCHPSIALVTRPDESAEAVARVLRA